MLDLKKTTEAIAALRKAASIHPGCEQCDLHLALVLPDTGSDVEALWLRREVIRLNPANVSARYQLGKTLAQRKENIEAVAEPAGDRLSWTRSNDGSITISWDGSIA